DILVFFFSSRRRHTRFSRDWSSDVCSSDLNQYDIQFLKAMCDLCFEWKLGKICITPWKSFIIKGIPAASKLQWEKLLGRFGINVRHSLLEMNWHLPVANEELLQLKRYIVSCLDPNDISTYGLTHSLIGHNN